jgi:hypothetical protein
MEGMTARDQETLGQQIGRWGETYPSVRSNAAALWDEARGAFAWFSEADIPVAEALRRWTLVVHLVHNFKSQQFIRDVAQRWPTASVPGGPDWPEQPAQIPRQQRELVSLVGLTWRSSVTGFGPATTSALLALLHPDEWAILDRYTAPPAVSLAIREPALADHRPAFADFVDRRDRHRRLVFYEHAYMPLLRAIAQCSGVALLQIERGMFLIGEHLSSTASGQGWPQYHAAPLHALTEGPPSRSTRRGQGL